jgi:hypothetical protein
VSSRARRRPRWLWTPQDLGERVVHHECVARARLRLPGDEAEDEFFDLRRDAFDSFARGDRRVAHHRHEKLDTPAVKRQLSREHLVEDDAERVEVPPCPCRRPVHVLRGDVARCSEALLRERELRRVDDLGDPEVRQLDDFLLRRSPGQEHVLRLEVTVDDAELVRAREGGRHLHRHPRCPPPREGAVAKLVEEALAFDVLHHEEDEAVGLPEVRDLDDAGVVDPIDGARFAEEPLAVGGVHAEVLPEHLDRRQALDHDVPCEIDQRHPADAEPLHEPIARGQRPADERVGVLDELGPVDGAKPRVVRVRLGAPRAELHPALRLRRSLLAVAEDGAHRLGIRDRREDRAEGVIAIAAESAARGEGARLGTVENQEDVVQVSPGRIDDVGNA